MLISAPQRDRLLKYWTTDGAAERQRIEYHKDAH